MSRSCFIPLCGKGENPDVDVLYDMLRYSCLGVQGRNEHPRDSKQIVMMPSRAYHLAKMRF